MTINMQDFTKHPIRLLKDMRKFHRKLRANHLHRSIFNQLSMIIKGKQEAFLQALKAPQVNRKMRRRHQALHSK